MKRTSIVVLIMLLTVTLWGCDKWNGNKVTENKTNENDTNEDKTNNSNRSYVSFQDLPIDNETDLKTALMEEYSLSELNSCFGDYSDVEKSIYQMEFNPRSVYFDDVINSFPISNCRFNDDCCYSVYKVKEGGLFYVFWMELGDRGIVVSDTFYIKELRKATDFDVLQPGVSTYEDVNAIDPASEVYLLFSSGVYSYSLLDNETLLKIEYKFTYVKNRKDLVVSNIRIQSIGPSEVYQLAYIYKKDMP